jgi:hypothetical protein
MSCRSLLSFNNSDRATTTFFFGYNNFDRATIVFLWLQKFDEQVVFLFGGALVEDLILLAILCG